MATRENNHVVLTPTEARQGIKLGRMRYVLGISMVLVIIALVLTFWLS